ncbi:MAG TPA: hypothetical protein HA257_08245 [Candidatus Methanoperedenaceae archaeon]|nr:hypothetical protein [Candidatus Methanoperedenaceae archaeon]
MPEINFGLLDNFAIKNWYRFLLYIGGVILILSMFLEPKGITIVQVRTFSIHTIILCLIVWIIYDIFSTKIERMNEYYIKNHETELIILKYLISFVALFIWIALIVSKVY